MTTELVELLSPYSDMYFFAWVAMVLGGECYPEAEEQWGESGLDQRMLTVNYQWTKMRKRLRDPLRDVCRIACIEQRSCCNTILGLSIQAV